MRGGWRRGPSGYGITTLMNCRHEGFGQQSLIDQDLQARLQKLGVSLK